MDINIQNPEFDAVIQNYLLPVGDELKRIELSRRLVEAAGALTEEDRAHIINASDAFTYIIQVNNGLLSIERYPQYEGDTLLDNVIVDTRHIIKTLLPDRVNVAMGEAGPELAELVKSQIAEHITELLGGVLS